MTQVTPGIYRGALPFEQGFTRIPNQWLRDNRIGFRSKGLLSYLLSHEVGYTITLGQIERETGDGRHAIRAAVEELVQAGYLITKRTHDERGYNAGLAWLLQDPNPKSENPTLENPRLENHTALEENFIEKKTSRETLLQAGLEAGWEEFWNVYPRKQEKKAARLSFEKALKETTLEVLLAGARRYAADPNRTREFTKLPATWLNRGCWDDEALPERTLTPEQREAKLLADKEARWERDRIERERRQKEHLAEQERIERERRENPVERCAHNRIKVMCRNCS
jgi:hypothetical protein